MEKTYFSLAVTNKVEIRPGEIHRLTRTSLVQDYLHVALHVLFNSEQRSNIQSTPDNSNPR